MPMQISHFSVRGLCQEYDTEWHLNLVVKTFTWEGTGNDFPSSILYSTLTRIRQEGFSGCPNTPGQFSSILSPSTPKCFPFFVVLWLIFKRKSSRCGCQTPQSSAKSGSLWGLNHKTCLGKPGKCFFYPTEFCFTTRLTNSWLQIADTLHFYHADDLLAHGNQLHFLS